MLASAPKPAEFKPIGKGKKIFFSKGTTGFVNGAAVFLIKSHKYPPDGCLS